MRRCQCPRRVCWGTQVSLRCSCQGSPKPGLPNWGSSPPHRCSRAAVGRGGGEPGGTQQGQGSCPGLRGTASPSRAVSAEMMLQFTTTARLSWLPAEPACGCDVPRNLCGSRVAHENQPWQPRLALLAVPLAIGSMVPCGPREG